MSRLNNNNRGAYGMNKFQPRRGGGPGGPMRGSMMGNSNFRNHPFQNRRDNFNRSPGQPSPQKPHQDQQSLPIIPPPPPGPALTMKGPIQEKLEAAGSQAKIQTPPANQVSQPAKADSEQLKSPGGKEQQKPPQNVKPEPQSPKPAPQPDKKPGVQQGPQQSPQQSQRPGTQQGPQQNQRPGTQQGPPQGQRPGTQQGTQQVTPQGQRPGTQPGTQQVTPQGQRPGTQPGTQQGTPQGQRLGSQQGTPQNQRPGTQQGTPQNQRPGTQQGPQQGQRPGTQQGPQQGQRPGTQQGPQQGQKPGTQEGQRPGTQPSPQQGQRQGPQQGSQSGNEPAPQPGQRPGTQQVPQQGQRSGQRPRFHFDDRPGPQQAQKPAPNAKPPQSVQDNTNTPEADQSEPSDFKATLSRLLKPGEKPYTQRCRLFIGNLPKDITEDEFKFLFEKYGEPNEVFINKAKGFGFIRLESRALAEVAKAELDDTPMRGRTLRVRFATHSAALSVKNLSPFVSNELLEEAFSQFGIVERAIVIVDDRGRSTGKGIVEFASKPSARKALDRCNDGVFLLTASPRPVVVEPLEQFDDEDGFPEKLAQKNLRFQAEREEPPRFARPGTFEFEYSKRWKSMDEMEKQQRQQVEKNMQEAREKLESEMEDAYHEHQANMLRQELARRQEELRRMEEMHSQEMQKRKEMQLRQEEERRRREEDMLRKREMEEQMRRQREESYRMGGFMDRDTEIRLGSSGTLTMADMSFGTSNQSFSMGGMGFESQQGMGAASSGGLMSSEMRNERFSQGGARGMGPANPGFGRVREEFDGPSKKPRF